jgi:hypothetical protein
VIYGVFTMRVNMKQSLWAAVLILSLSSSAFADQAPPVTPPSADQQQLAASTKKLWTGIALIGAGAVAMPITSSSPENFNALVGGTLIGAGTVFVLWGARQRYKVANPTVVVGLGIGSAKLVRITRVW